MKGFTLLEVVVCLFVTTLGLCAVMGVTARVLHVTEQALYDEGF